MKYEMIRKSVEEQNDRKTVARLTSISQARGEELDQLLRRWLTSFRWAKYQVDEIDRNQAVQYAISRMMRICRTELDDELARLDQIAAAIDATEIVIYVDWVKSRTWGHNPHATVQVRLANGTRREYKGTASGCGYDKESAAVAEALNQSLAVTKLLCNLKEQALQDGKSDVSPSSVTGIHNEDCCGYGAGYEAIPYFERGVGMTTFKALFTRCGCQTCENHGRASDVYWITCPDKEVAENEAE